MKKLFLASIILGLMISGCHTAKQAQRVVKDSVVTTSPAAALKPVDSTQIIKAQLADILNAPINFTTFYGRAKANFNSPQASGNATVYIKMKKDSAIWISITGPLNIEGARILVTPDSVKIINKLDGTLQLSSIARLRQITKLPLTFSDFQNIILGKALLNNDTLHYNVKQDSVIVASGNDVLKYFYSFTKNNFLLGQSNIETVNNASPIIANIYYNNYNEVNNINFSASRDIAISGSASASLQLNFKEYNFNQPQSFVFTISKNYTIKYE
ncbi:MAG: DUF4292 domain-containing protein [Parafilimonas sp.]